uniref:Ig-like domain-containing protein n=1 Tax=Sciurus vulgaris TaxID=55149 RepID=A0A8D2JR35_SCIVU
MLWTLALLLAILPPGSQTSSSLEGRMMSITRPIGSTGVITCDFVDERNYIHWYQIKERKAPQHLLYYDFFSSKTMVDSGLNPAKYHAYEGADRRYKLVVRNLEESDSGTYYCAAWDQHSPAY